MAPIRAESARNTCRIVTGRLLEIDVCAGYRSVQDVEDMKQRIREQMMLVAEPTRVVIAADWRACPMMTPPVAERVVGMLSAANPANARIERSAILHLQSQPTSVLQMMRLANEANLAHRRVFTEPEAMERWLAEVLTPAEAARVHAHLYKTDDAR